MSRIIPNNFPIPSPPATALFSFSEILSGRGIIQLFLADFTPTATPTYGLVENTSIYSNIGYVRKSATESFDIDFDLSIEKTLRVEGTAVFSIPIAVFGVGGGGGTFNKNFTITLYKVSNSVETQIAQAVININESVAASTVELYRRTAKMDVPVTKLVRNDSLRINITSESIATGFQCMIAFDPKNRDLAEPSGFGAMSWTTIGSESYILVPIRLK